MTLHTHGSRTAPIPLRHSNFNRMSLLNWIRDCSEAGSAMPTDAQIMERYRFGHLESARTLLADLADRGWITIRGMGADRQISLGRVRSADPQPAPRPVPSVVRPETKPTSAKAGAERIADILRGVQAKKAAPKPVVEPTAKPTLAEQVADAGSQFNTAFAEAGRMLAQNARRFVEAGTIEARPVKAAIASVAPEDKATYQVSAYFRADRALYDRITAAARAEGKSVSNFVGQIAKAALTDARQPEPAQPERKTLLRAEMTAAAIRNDMPIDGFVRMLLERGFQTFLADEQKELAA